MGVMEKHPTGLLMATGKNQLSCVFWQSKDTSQETLWLNLIGGVCHKALENGTTSKKEILKYLKKILGE